MLAIDRGSAACCAPTRPTAWRGDGFREVFAYDPDIRIWGGNVQTWVDAALARREMTPNFEDGLRCQEILDAAIRSANERRWVDL